MMSSGKLDTSVAYLKGVGPRKGDLLGKELQIYTLRDLLFHFPFRYVDRTKFYRIGDLTAHHDQVQLKGVLRGLQVVGSGRKKRMTGRLRDESGVIDLVWFKGLHWLEKHLQIGMEYVVFGRVNAFQGRLSVPHPEMEAATDVSVRQAATLSPVYPSTEKLASHGLDARGQRKLIKQVLQIVGPDDIPETLPASVLSAYRFPGRAEALRGIHFPRDTAEMQSAINRLKFEELFFLQLRLLRLRNARRAAARSFVFDKVGDYFLNFFHHHLPFALTNAQKRVIKEVRRDLGSGCQMNRLLQGDVGSGKTIVALMCMLIAIDNGYQACLLAPTEILARQHFDGLAGYLEKMNLQVGLLTGSIKGKSRRHLLEALKAGEINILVGTHAVLEDPVVFQNLGLAITDEQHRFGVKQRARLWKKSREFPPHVLVMTATPIPRTLAMTLYGDLDVSVIDELPPGRKPVQTLHWFESQRARVHGFMREQIALGRQVYVVYPLIEESEALDLQNLEEGFVALQRAFPMPDYQISIVHGRMKAEDKDFEMKRFVEGKTQIMVATTVIEVGVNVPNASVMVIENAERFGLSQLHQLRGRVGRGADQSFCILMSGNKLSNEGKERLQTMVRTTDGFEIAEADLRLRGPGDIEGTRQSGLVQLRLADLAKDGTILQAARKLASEILREDPGLNREAFLPVRRHMAKLDKQAKGWSRIS